MSSWLGIVSLGLSLSAACGGNADGGGGSCGKVQPCGGDPVGTWKLTDSCIDADAIGQTLISALGAASACSTAKLESADANQTGTATFSADMTYSAQFTTTFKGTVQVPSSCISQGGFTLTCDQLGQLLLPLLKGTVTSLACSKASDGCSCKVETAPQTSNESGTYSVSGTHMARSANGGNGGEFCVKGDELHLIALDSMGSGKIVSDVVASRQ